MIRIVIDESLKHEFLRARESCEVVDSAGNSLGCFTPTSAGSDCPYPDDELRRIDEKGGGRPLKDILRDLEGRA